MNAPVAIAVCGFLVVGFACLEVGSRTEDGGSGGASNRVSTLEIGGEQFSVPVGGGRGWISAPVHTPHSFGSFRVSWKLLDDTALCVEHRVSSDGVHWGSWRALHEDHHSRFDSAGQFSNLLRFGEVQIFDRDDLRYFQLRLEAPSGGEDGSGVDGAAPVRSFRAVVVRPTAPGSITVPVGERSYEFRITGDGDGTVDRPAVVSRTAWGCPDGQDAPLWPPDASNDVKFLIVHHTAGSNTSRNWAATVPAISSTRYSLMSARKSAR